MPEIKHRDDGGTQYFSCGIKRDPEGKAVGRRKVEKNE